MKKHGLTVKRLADDHGFSENTIKNYRSKRTTPRVRFLEQIKKCGKLSSDAIADFELLILPENGIPLGSAGQDEILARLDRQEQLLRELIERVSEVLR